MCTMSMTVPKAAEIDTETDMISAFLDSVRMCLLSSTLSVTSNTVLTDCTAREATFTGYSRSHLSTWTTPAIDADSAASSVSTGSFTGTAAGGTGSLYGYFLTDSAGVKFYGVEVFSTPISEGQNVTLDIDLDYTVLTRY